MDGSAAPPPPAETMSPVMAQFFAAKAKQPDALLFFRMGDFYELFFEDAEKAAGALGIALTKRGKHQGGDIAMAGVPVHAAEAYLAKLIRAGFKVAVVEQVEDPAEARKRGSKSVVRRELVRVVTPGTLTEDGLLDARGANRLAAVAVRAGQAALASVELSTGEVESVLLAPEDLAAAVAGMSPSETLVPDRLLADAAVSAAVASGGLLQPMPSALAEPGAAEARLKRLYGVDTLAGFGGLQPAEVSALGLLAANLETTQAGKLPALRPPRRILGAEVMSIDPATRASLEIDRAQDGGRSGSLLACIDRTVTAGGARLLAARLTRPLLDVEAIGARLDAVGWFAERRRLREDVRGLLAGSGDMARSLGRLVLGRGGPRDLGVIRAGLRAGEAIAARFTTEGVNEALSEPPDEITAALDALGLAGKPELARFAAELEAGLAPELPQQARDGGYVAEGYRPELDAARALRDDSRRVIAALETRLQGETGVALRVRHNAVLGYFVEASAKAGEPLLRPPLNAQFIHRQTMANQVRFTTVELAELDARIAQAADRALAIELETFEAFRARAEACAGAIQAAAQALARLDVAAGGAEWAEEVSAVRPVVDGSTAFEAEGARHSVVEAAVKKGGGAFTPNDCRLDGAGRGRPRLAIVTGPNMAGKSTFLRQNALLAVLAQAGCYVPARSLRLGAVDRLFSRVGAGDDLARGRSTFMTEMVETAAILTQATPRSLVVLDEIGRGTATYDGLAIAWACAEALHDGNRCRALFATHYHELARLEGRLAHVGNLSMRAREWNGELVFLHEAGPGAADKSYGVQVAKLAGVPTGVVARAREVLERLEGTGSIRPQLDDLPLFAAVRETPAPPPQPSRAEAALAAVDPDGMSPREALEALYRLKGMVRCVSPIAVMTLESGQWAELEAALGSAAAGVHDEGELRRRALPMLRTALAAAQAEARCGLEAGGVGGVETARALSDAADAIVLALHAFTLRYVLRDHNPTAGERLAVVAVGGYGRGVLAPFSDLDLLFLRPWKPTPHGERVTEFMLYSLWDLGLKVGHASRTVDETLKLAKADLSIRTGLLDARLLAGDAELFEQLQRRFRREVARGGGPAFSQARLAERDARHAKAGTSRYLVEPNVKDGKGGLRDLNTLLWIARFLNPEEPAEVSALEYFNGAEMAQLRRCYDRLWRVRHHLHWTAGRAEERLGFDLQPEVARRMGFAAGGRSGTAGVERFMRRYFVNAREVGALTRVFCAKLEAERTKAKPSGLSRLVPASLRLGKVDVPGFRVVGGRLTVEDAGVLVRDPVNLLRLFRTADARDLDLHPQALAMAQRALPGVTRSVRRDPEAARVFLDVLARGRQPFRALSLMNDAGVLGRFVPEFGRIVSRTQLDRHHAYTVDEHTLRMTGLLADIAAGREAEAHPLATALLPRITDGEALALAVLLHDVGKGGEGGQLVAGGRHARRACERLGLAPERVQLVVWLVEHHLLLSDYAQRRDVSDPGTVAAFATAVGDLERLRLLLVLTVVDMRAVGPGVWNAWKGQLMRELYAATEAVFRGGRGADPASAFRRRRAEAADAARAALFEVEPGAAGFATGMDDAYFTEFGPEEQGTHARLLAEAAVSGAAAAVRLRPERNVAEAVVATADRPGLFADLAEVLAAEGANVLAARLNTAKDGQALDVFQLQDATGAPYGAMDPGAAERLVARLEAAAAGDLFGRRTQRGPVTGPEVAASIVFDPDSSEEAAIIEVSGRDRPGVLAELARALADAGLSVSSAHIDGAGLKLADAFYVTDAAGTKPDAAALERARAALGAVLAEPAALAGAGGAL